MDRHQLAVASAIEQHAGEPCHVRALLAARVEDAGRRLHWNEGADAYQLERLRAHRARAERQLAEFDRGEGAYRAFARNDQTPPPARPDRSKRA